MQRPLAGEGVPSPAGITVQPANPRGSVSPSLAKAPAQGERRRSRFQAPQPSVPPSPRGRFTWGGQRGRAERGTAS